MCPSSQRAESLKALVDSAPRAELAALAGDLAAALGAALARAAAPPASNLVLPVGEAPGALLTVEEAAERLHVPTSWIYRHWKRLGFGRKLGHRTVRIEAHALERWAAKQAPSSRYDPM